MPPLMRILANLGRTRFGANLTLVPVSQSYEPLMTTLSYVRGLEPVQQANAYAFFWAECARRYPCWEFAQVAGAAYGYFLPVLRLAPVGASSFVHGSSLVVEQLGIPGLCLLASGGSNAEYDAVLASIAGNRLQQQSAPILELLREGELRECVARSIELEQGETLENTVWRDPLLRTAGRVVNVLLPHIPFAGHELLDIGSFDLLEPDARIELGLQLRAALAGCHRVPFSTASASSSRNSGGGSFLVRTPW